MDVIAALAKFVHPIRGAKPGPSASTVWSPPSSSRLTLRWRKNWRCKENRGKGGRNFLRKFLPPFLRTPLPSLFKDFHPYRIPYHDSCGSWTIRLRIFFLIEEYARHRQKSPSAYEGGPFFISTIGNRDSIKSKVFGRGGGGVWGRGGETFLKKSFSSLPNSFSPKLP